MSRIFKSRRARFNFHEATEAERFFMGDAAYHAPRPRQDFIGTTMERLGISAEDMAQRIGLQGSLESHLIVPQNDHVPSSRMTPAQYMRQIMTGQEIPTGEITLALCDVMNIAPHELLNRAYFPGECPAHVVEAEVLYGIRERCNRNRLSPAVRDFLWDEVEAANDMGMRKSRSMNVSYAEAILRAFAVYIGTISIEREVQFAREYDTLSPVAYEHRKLQEAVLQRHTYLENAIEVRGRARDEAVKYHGEAKRTMQLTARELARGGKDDDFIADYRRVVKDKGHSFAADYIRDYPEEVTSVWASSWQRSSRLKLTTGKEAVGEHLLKIFTNAVKHTDNGVDVVARAKVFVTDGYREMAQWDAWWKTRSAKRYLQAVARSRLIQKNFPEFAPRLVPALSAPHP